MSAEINDSIEDTRTRESASSLAKTANFLDQLANRSQQQRRRRYGNMLVVLETDKILITLGPDYPCFIFSFIMFSVAGYYLVTFVNSAFQNIFIKLLNILVVIVQQTSYLLIAVSNPGIALQQNMPSEDTAQAEEQQKKRYCLKCKVRMYDGMKHCKRCDVCIKGYDHHCPWTSKCIGKTNMKRFMFFVSIIYLIPAITPIYLMYFIVMMMISLAITSSESTNPKL